MNMPITPMHCYCAMIGDVTTYRLNYRGDTFVSVASVCMLYVQECTCSADNEVIAHLLKR